MLRINLKSVWGRGYVGAARMQAHVIHRGMPHVTRVTRVTHVTNVTSVTRVTHVTCMSHTLRHLRALCRSMQAAGGAYISLMRRPAHRSPSLILRSLVASGLDAPHVRPPELKVQPALQGEGEVAGVEALEVV